jgi:hypothetical protein
MSTPSLLNIPYLYKAGTLYSQIPESGAGDFIVQRTTTVANRSTRINKDGFIETVLDNVPRLDYPLGGAVNGCPALLVEPAATNGIRNNSMVGASAPNTLPNNWSNAGSNLTRQSVATGTLNGIPYVDIRISGTATNSFHDVFWDASNVIAALVGQDWVASCYLQIIAQPNPPVNYLLAMREFNSSGGFLGVFQGAALSISTTSFNRFSFTRVLNQAAVAFVHPSLFFTLVNGQYYDFTIRIGYPQMERGTVPTSVIPTTTAAVTRSEDRITKTGITSLIGQTEGTFYFEGEAEFAGSDLPMINRSTQNSVLITKNTANRLLGYVYYNSVWLSWITPAPVIGPFKAAIAYKQGSPGDSAFFVNGVQVGTTSTTNWAFTGALNDLIVRSEGWSSGTKPYKVRALEVFPNRIPNTAAPGVLSLATLTAL